MREDIDNAPDPGFAAVFPVRQRRVIRFALTAAMPIRRSWDASKARRRAKAFTAKGITVRCEVCVGEPAREIVRAAARGRADVIVMGSHRVDPKRRFAGLGPTSYKVGILCRCPILLVK